MSTRTLVGTPDREPSRASTITHAVTMNTASGPVTNLATPWAEPAGPVVTQAAASTVERAAMIADAGDDPVKLRDLARTLLERAELAEREVEQAEKDATEWESAGRAAIDEADRAMFRRSLIDRAGDLAHAGHDRFPWRMCGEEVCTLLQQATGRNISTG